ncbi:Hypothetical predicted protein [Marmota monax]|uniref:Uncharacterized protein n=1 Tax=Marmota monax TaxID=9995 RepID=A0A5E4CUX0_MARMO|nr:hypothetical protein GHT09_009934 [Marmota monax]VTJ85618.1 Hypothetical predicted protein [Marmota monax]
MAQGTNSHHGCTTICVNEEVNVTYITGQPRQAHCAEQHLAWIRISKETEAGLEDWKKSLVLGGGRRGGLLSGNQCLVASETDIIQNEVIEKKQ